jgi:hypothetical protein
MSVATEFPPAVFIPERARRLPSAAPTRQRPLRLVPPVEGCQPVPSGSVRRGTARISARPAETLAVVGSTVPSLRAAGSVQLRTRALRLTRRGLVAVAAGVVAAGGLLLLVAHLSLGAPEARPALGPGGVVIVQPGDTLWSIAGQIDPGRDPRLVIERIRRSNHLDSVSLTPGQTLKVG